jgi:hypothetical protein
MKSVKIIEMHSEGRDLNIVNVKLGGTESNNSAMKA